MGQFQLKRPCLCSMSHDNIALSFVYPIMYYLISIFTPTNRELDDDLFDLIYRPI